ncbi:LOW QUALITY PROTEIN: immunoglobulin superfamily member 5 [Pholidichthys leucotaenia]
MDIFPMLVLLFSCRIEVGAKMTLSPLTLTVLRGETARFTCDPSNTQWTVMTWMLNGKSALTISKETGVLPSINQNLTAEKHGESWVFSLKNTERDDEGGVTCDLQGIDARTASLFVQEKGIVKVSGDDKLAFKDQSVLFECQAAGWYPQPVLQWKVNGQKVSQSDYNISSEELGENLFTVTSSISVVAEMSCDVDCLASVSALQIPLKSSMRLTVVAEVLQKQDDCTVPVAVTAALSAILLLILLCICTVLCYRQRRQENADHNDLFREAHSQMDFASFRKVPDVVSSSSLSLQSESQARICPSEDSCMTVRRITTV